MNVITCSEMTQTLHTTTRRPAWFHLLYVKFSWSNQTSLCPKGPVFTLFSLVHTGFLHWGAFHSSIWAPKMHGTRMDIKKSTTKCQ